MTVELNVDLFNYTAGGLREDGSYDVDSLVAALTEPPVPHLLALCEAKFWHARGRRPFQTVIKHLSIALDRPYVGELFTGPLGTAIIYDPTLLCLDASEEAAFDDKRNLARFSLRTHPDTLLNVIADHWSYHDSDQRLARARVLARYGATPTPTVVAVDANCTGSGPHLPVPFWGHQPPGTLDYRYQQQPDGTWIPDTRPIDRLIGVWHQSHPHDPGRPDAHGEPGRRGGAGLHHLAELDPHTPRPFPPTGDAGMHVDYLLANNALVKAATVVPGSYRIHQPAGFPPPRYSDHQRVSCTLHWTVPAHGESP